MPRRGRGVSAGLDRASRFTREGAVEDQLTAAPDGRRFPIPLPDFLIAANVSWEVDIWRRLRNARDASPRGAQRCLRRQPQMIEMFDDLVNRTVWSLPTKKGR